MVRAFAADLHVHTYLSPCAAREMSPQAIVGRCLELGLDIIAPADHNSAANVEAMALAASGTGLVVICGMEVCTKEEVHVITLLPNVRAMAEWESKVARSRAPGVNAPSIFGDQWAFSPQSGDIVQETSLLAAPTLLSLEEIVQGVGALGGICVPCHVDRRAFSILAQLGFVPEHLDIPALEVSKVISQAEARRAFPATCGRTLVSFSDAHSLNEIGLGCSLFWLEEPTFDEIVLALRGEAGRYVEVE
ncbi:MAG: PHP domain-containing protein [Firmicutes bacterium]|jgi:PHP family Zn ribbon phosphoesterase|nr:PHP domain-containing protein [Bacillota bacterium]MDD4336769.1 PHP domain-containing protein [Bacillota bacterium]MDD4791495.1 PHP domain-containing protein [Bacillota bacterium]